MPPAVNCVVPPSAGAARPAGETRRNTAIRPVPVGTIAVVSRRLHRPRSVRVALLLLTAALAAASCVDDVPTVPADAASPSAPSTTRLQLTPSEGSLRVRVEGIGHGTADLDHVLVVGDSVAVLVADDLGNEIDATLHVDAVDCRRLDRGFTGPCGAVPAGATVTGGVDAVAEAVDELAEDGIVPDAAVLVLANNAAVDAADLDAVMAAAAEVPRVWWVNARVLEHGYQDPNNRALDALARRDPRAAVVDWFHASGGQDDWLADLVHPSDEGQRALAALIADHLRCDCTP